MATVKRKTKKTVFEGNVYIQATFNNTIVTVTDLKATPSRGRVPADSGSAEQRNPLRMLRRPLPRKRQRPPWTADFRK